jgi:hypothetical protein
MPEPITLIVLGGLVYGWMKGRAPAPGPAASGHPSTDVGQALAITPAAATAQNQPISIVTGTGPDSPLATPSSVVNAPIAPLANAGAAIPIPSDGLITALDNDTALALRAYAALNPEDFQLFLDRYADRVVLRDDLFFQAVQAPPPGGFQPTPGMIAGMGMAAYKVAQGLNGVAVGNYGDLFGVAATASGQIPGINPDMLHALQGLALGYRAFSSATLAMTQISDLAFANGVSVVDMTAALFGVGEGAAGLTAGLTAPIASLSGVLMVVGLVVDIGFTIAGNAPDIQKAIDVALDVASIAVLFIPVIGIVIAVIIQLVKFIIDLFGGDLFGGGLSHEQREVLETARYGENLNPMFPALAADYTPRELFQTIVQWGSGYCGGQHVVAMSVSLILKAGDVLSVGGRPYTVPADTLLGFGLNEPTRCYWLAGSPFADITNDEQAWALAEFGSTNGVFAMAQAGIADWRKTQFNDPTVKLIAARTAPMKNFLDHGFSLDQIDQVALEYRAQPHLTALATAYGAATWQELLGAVLAVEWLVFNWTNSHGSLSDFAKANGFPTMYAFRAAALETFERYYGAVQTAAAALYQKAIQAQGEQVAALMLIQQQMSASAP